MTLDWQTSLALALVIVAAIYLARRGWQVVARKTGGCGACGNCPADQTPSGKPLVPLESLAPPRRSDK